VILFLKILGGIAALALGIFLGFGRYTQPQEEIEARMAGSSGKPRRAKRHFMWLNYFRAQERASVRGRPRPRFKTVVARDKKDRV
jgi:hypothetical protein